MLFSAAAIFYGLGLAFDLIYIIQYNLRTALTMMIILPY